MKREGTRPSASVSVNLVSALVLDLEGLTMPRMYCTGAGPCDASSKKRKVYFFSAPLQSLRSLHQGVCVRACVFVSVRMYLCCCLCSVRVRVVWWSFLPLKFSFLIAVKMPFLVCGGRFVAL